MPLYNRVVDVRVGKAGSEKGMLVTDLRVTFTAKKTLKSSSNMCQVSIYNLNETSRNQIQNIDDIFILSAGYKDEGGAEILFVGNITKFEHKYQAPEWISTIEFNDGAKTLRDTKLSISFAPGKAVKDVIKSVAKSFGNPIKFFTSEGGSQQFAQGFADIGTSKQMMDALCEKAGYEWCIQNGEIKVVPVGKADGLSTVLLSPDTGMIGSPEKVEDTGTSGIQGQKKAGWKVRSLLLPKLEPAGRVSIQGSKAIKTAVYRVEAVEHKGDTHGEEWTTETLVTAL